MKIGNLIFNFPIDTRNNSDILELFVINVGNYKCLKYISPELVVYNGKYLVGIIIRNDNQKSH